ncbi:MAG TPA: hypothetical protein PKB02_01560 [Anaerohalosphaeraceae bacterium]|nr:hypothetical protein [Anaerohalosphaeraceae bacterium]
MQEQIQQDSDRLTVKITRTGMEEQLGEAYKRCWAYAFNYASQELDLDDQIENLCREFDLLRPQALWFVNGANAILLQKEVKEIRQANQNGNISKKDTQQELAEFPGVMSKNTKPSENYVSQLEMMAFLEDVEEMSHDVDFEEFWEELGKIKQQVIEQYCATEKEVLTVFRIRSAVERAQEENERFFDAYPVSTGAWENGHFDHTGEITY